MTVLRPSDSLVGRFLYQLNRRGVGVVPLGLAQALAIPPADAMHALLPSKRRFVAQNLAQVTGLPADDPRVQRLVRTRLPPFGPYIQGALPPQTW